MFVATPPYAYCRLNQIKGEDDHSHEQRWNKHRFFRFKSLIDAAFTTEQFTPEASSLLGGKINFRFKIFKKFKNGRHISKLHPLAPAHRRGIYKKKKRNAAQLATLALADFANLQLNNEENCF